MHQGKFEKSPKKPSRLRFYKVLVFHPLFLTVSANYAKLKTFFLRDDPPSKPLLHMPSTSKCDLGTKSIKKSENKPWNKFSPARPVGVGSHLGLTFETQVRPKKKSCFFTAKTMWIEALRSCKHTKHQKMMQKEEISNKMSLPIQTHTGYSHFVLMRAKKSPFITTCPFRVH